MTLAIQGYKRIDVQYEDPKPISGTKAQIEAYAGKVGLAMQFAVGGNISSLIESINGRIHYVAPDEEQEGDESGSLYVHGEADFDIVLPNYTNAMRDRFTVGHELGHYLLHARMGAIPIIVNRKGSDLLEWQANWFSAALLMPEDSLRSDFITAKGDLYMLAFTYQVSIQAMAVRCKSLNLR